MFFLFFLSFTRLFIQSYKYWGTFFKFFYIYTPYTYKTCTYKFYLSKEEYYYE